VSGIPQLVWFKRDLRMQDHEPLTAAAVAGPILPFVAIEEGWWTGYDMSARQYAFFCESAAELTEAFADRSVSLHVHTGDVTALLAEALITHGPFALWAHQETGNAWSYARDIGVRSWMRHHGLAYHELVQNGVRRGSALDRDRWARDWNTQMNRPVLAAPPKMQGLTLTSSVALSPMLPNLAPDPITERQRGGRRAALAILDSFLTARGRDYRTDMSSPILGAQGCSRLSAHLAWGTVSIREVFQATCARLAELQDDKSADAKGWRASLGAFIGRLHWHCHFAQKLEAEPELEWRPTARVYEGMRPPADRAVTEAFAQGQTGFPFVDACMRQLAATGWINFRMRAMLMSFACYDLWMPWQTAGAILARLFTDYDPGIHWPQSQMQSGETGINTLRIYSSVKQGNDHDPDGRYTRQWVPELAGVEGGAVHEPWLIGGIAGYPQPLVEHASASKAARDAIWTIRHTDAAKREAAEILARHGSRRRPSNRKHKPVSQPRQNDGV
jgi:deoxyribodipyrimidine photo-lyase